MHIVFTILLAIEVSKAYHSKTREKVHTCGFKDKGTCF